MRVRDAIDIKYARGLVWATVSGSADKLLGAPLKQRVQGFARQVSCWRILLDCRQVVGVDLNRRATWQQHMLQHFSLPTGARAALVCCTAVDATVTRPSKNPQTGRPVAIFTDTRVAVRWLRAGVSKLVGPDSAPVPIGAIKELLHQYALARRNGPEAQITRELGELYRYLVEQAGLIGFDAQQVMDAHRAALKPRRPRLVPQGCVGVRASKA